MERFEVKKDVTVRTVGLFISKSPLPKSKESGIKFVPIRVRKVSIFKPSFAGK